MLSGVSPVSTAVIAREPPSKFTISTSSPCLRNSPSSTPVQKTAIVAVIALTPTGRWYRLGSAVGAAGDAAVSLDTGRVAGSLEAVLAAGAAGTTGATGAAGAGAQPTTSQ